MASKSEADQILETNTSNGTPRLQQDSFERTEKRSNWTALALILLTGLFLTFAFYIWHSNGASMIAYTNTANPPTSSSAAENNTTATAPAANTNTNPTTTTTNQ